MQDRTACIATAQQGPEWYEIGLRSGLVALILGDVWVPLHP